MKRYLFGTAVLVLIFFQAGREISDQAVFRYGILACLAPIGLMLVMTARGSGRIFLTVSISLTLLLLVRGNAGETIFNALLGVGFFIAFFSSLTALRDAASASVAMTRAGTFLATRPPGLRYLSLTVGAQAFSLMLSYGAIQLLGTLALNSAQSEPDAEIRTIRTRRMLLAIQRGFISSLSWSPLAFSIAISVAVIPGTSWLSLAIPGAITSALILGIGWAMDSIFKPRVSRAPRPRTGDFGTAATLIPLVLLLLLILLLVSILEVTTHIRVVGLVLMVIPLISLIWLWIQTRHSSAFHTRLKSYIADELPSYRGEILLIASAGYIGSTGSALIAPYISADALDLTMLPTWAILIGLVWIMPIFGQLGANPILTMSLVGPLLPPASSLGISPSALAVALICGWTMAGLTSPFTATNLLVGRFGNVKALTVGWVWNGAYFAVTISALCGWALIYAAL